MKNNVRNKARVEGSICNAYLVEEASTFCSYYFDDHVRTKFRDLHHGQAEIRHEDYPDMLQIFKQDGRPFGNMSTRYLDSREYDAARLYVLLNCVEVADIYMA